MTDEEKKAIEFLIKRNEYMGSYRTALEQNIDIVLNLIEKQSKEIEEQKNINKKLSLEAQKYFDICMEQIQQIHDLEKKIEKRDKILTDLECFLKGISKNMKDEDFISSSIEYQNVLVKLYELKEKYQEEGE